MKEASLEELAKAPGMNKMVAAALYTALHDKVDEGNGNGDGQDQTEANGATSLGTSNASDGEGQGRKPTVSHPVPDGMFLTTNVIGRRENRRTSSHKR